jgi:DNA-binding winged helix-turn-helix (wHTH) protein
MSVTSLRPQGWMSAGCGENCRQVRAVPVGGHRAIWIDVHDERAHECWAAAEAATQAAVTGAADGFARGRLDGYDRGLTDGRAQGGAIVLLLLAPLMARPPAVVATGPLIVNLTGGRVSVDGTACYLSPAEWDLLLELAQRVGQICSAEALAAALWPDGCHRREPGRKVNMTEPLHALRVIVTRLRIRLGAAGNLIVNKPGVGYVLLDVRTP